MAFRFVVPGDEQSVELNRLLRSKPAERVVQQVCGLEPQLPLFEPVVAQVRQVQARQPAPGRLLAKYRTELPKGNFIP